MHHRAVGLVTCFPKSSSVQINKLQRIIVSFRGGFIFAICYKLIRNVLQIELKMFQFKWRKHNNDVFFVL